jgi:NTP pyrophosphatase (non-canonical NTP hydrolase)
MKAKPVKKVPQKANLAIASRSEVSDTGSGLFGVAKELGSEIGEVAQELRHLSYVETLSDHTADLASALADLAEVTALSIVARHGTDEDRALVVAKLKRRFEDLQES